MLPPDQIREQLERLLASQIFAESDRAQRLLRFIVGRTMEGQSQIVKESVIAVEVLGRPSSFDPRTDPIVRVEAGRLRIRLSRYYDSTGKDDPIIISVPKGGYVPDFSARQPESLSEPERPGQPAHSADDGKRTRVLMFCAVLAIGLSAGWGLYLFRDFAQPAEQSLRLSLLPPGGESVQASAISPDGHYLALAMDGGLWIRPLDQQDARQLPGTVGASNPFWSPDSRSIAFFTPGKLKRIELAGGPPREICDVDVGRGGSWSARGVIVFAPRPGGELFRVSAQGGPSQPITRLDASRGESGQAFPWFLPDGQRFIYSSVQRDTEPSIRLGSLDHPKTRFLVNGELGAAYSKDPNGSAKLIFVYRGALVAQSVDPDTLEFRGASAVIAPSVRIGSDRPGVSASAGGTVVFEPVKSKNRQLTWFDRNGRRLETVGPRNGYLTWALSPDDSHIAMEDEPSGGASGPSLWIFDIRRGSLSRIATQGVQAFSPVWSPDGSEVLFSDGTHSAMSLVRQRSDKTESVSVLDSPGIKVPTDWSSDGRFAAYFTSWPDFKHLTTWVAPLSSPRKESAWSFPAANANEFGATFSPASSPQGPRWIAYCSNETGRKEIYVKDFPLGLHRWIVSADGGVSPHWRHDGRELLYVAMNGLLMSVDVRSDAKSFVAGTPHTLFDTGINFRAVMFRGLPVNTYAVSRDGQRILLNRSVESEPALLTVLVRP